MSGNEMLGRMMFLVSCDVLALSISFFARSMACWWALLTFSNCFTFSIGRKLLFASKILFPRSLIDIPKTVAIGSKYDAQAGGSTDLAVLLGRLYLCCVVWGISTKAKKDLPTRMDKASAKSLKPRFAMRRSQVWTTMLYVYDTKVDAYNIINNYTHVYNQRTFVLFHRKSMGIPKPCSEKKSHEHGTNQNTHPTLIETCKQLGDSTTKFGENEPPTTGKWATDFGKMNHRLRENEPPTLGKWATDFGKKWATDFGEMSSGDTWKFETFFFKKYH